MAPSAENNGGSRTRWSKLTETYADSTWSFDKQPPTDAKKLIFQVIRHVRSRNLPLEVLGPEVPSFRYLQR